MVYTDEQKKVAEHGGFAHDDTNLIMLLSNPSFAPETVYMPVQTALVAPTILVALGLDPKKLKLVGLSTSRCCRDSRSRSRGTGKGQVTNRATNVAGPPAIREARRFFESEPGHVYPVTPAPVPQPPRPSP